MPTTRATTIPQRYEMMHLAQAGQTFQFIADQVGVSYWTARKWARRTRASDEAGLVSVIGRPPTGPLRDSSALVRYLALRLKRQHPRWGADYIRQQLQAHPGLVSQPVPSAVSLWRYWRTFGDRLFPPRHPVEPKLPQAGVVHGVWELDFKESLSVAGVGVTTFAQARDQVGRATVLHRIHPAVSAEQRIVKLTTAQVQADCRVAFTEWGLPDAIQTDHASLFQDDDPTPFPTSLNLWWVGLGIEPRRIPRHTPQANGSVERSHRTLNERTLFAQVFQSPAHLQAQVDRDWQELNTRCPSRARGCHGQPPIVAHPELLIPRRQYLPEREAELFDLHRIKTYLAQFTWVRTVNSHGQLSLGAHRYGLGHAWAGQKVAIRFAPEEHLFVFTALAPEKSVPGKSLGPLTRPARGLNPQEIMGPIELDHEPARQLPLPLSLGDLPLVPPPARLSERSPEVRD